MRNLVDDIVFRAHEGPVETTPKDYKADIEVRWCSGCGGFSILSQVQKIMPELHIPKEKIVFVSGIGCSSRFPYYMDNYGVHSMHGRAVAIASGLKVARPDLSVWVVTGDGDCISIGGNHFIHACRRNVDMNIIMFNNEIYSLTKGQYSPTSQVGQSTKSSPLGVLDDPFNPAGLALGSGASFVARAYDRDTKTMNYMFERASKHKGLAYIEVYTNCVIFNDGAFDLFTKKETRKENSVELMHGKPLVFGEHDDKGIKLDGFKPVVVSLADGKHSINDLLVHNEKDATLAFILANMTYDSALPRPMGVFQAIERPTYDEKVVAQLEYEAKKPGAGDVELLMKGDDCWEIK